MFFGLVKKKILGAHASAWEFDNLELEIVIPQILEQACKLTDCENAIWLLPEELNRLRTQDLHKKGKTTDQNIDRRFKQQSINKVNEDELREYLTLFSHEEKKVKLLNHQGRNFIFAPILNQKDEVLAVLLLVGVAENKKAQRRKWLANNLAKISKHVGFSIQHWETQRLAFLDDLTGLYNQKYLGLVLDNEIYRTGREENKFSVLFMDVDYFKSVNDSRGHWVGSHLLVEIGKALRDNVRRSDYAFRYGGDEFVIVLPMTNAAGAVLAGERLRSKIEKTNFQVDNQQINLTLSIGLATFPDHAKNCKDIIKMADEAMYCGKNKSRNIVFVAS